MNRCALILLLFLGVGAMHVQAQTPGPAFIDLHVLPSPAHADQVLRARSYFQSCFVGADVGSHTVAVVDHVITINVQMIPTPGVVCLATPPPPVPVDFIIGTLPPGDYTVIENAILTSGPGSFSPLTTSFSVGPAIEVIPATSGKSLAGLALLMMLAAWYGIGARSRAARADVR